MRSLSSAFSTFFCFLFLGISYLLVVPVNAGPEEVNHVQAAWYIGEKPSRIFEKELRVTSFFPNSIRINDAEGYLQNLDCFSQRMDVPSSCQKREISGMTKEEVPLIKRSLIYPLIIGIAINQLPFEDKFLLARIASFLTCYLILGLSIILLYKSRFDLNILFIAITSSCIFLFTVVNPSSLEVSAATLFIAVLISFDRELRFKSVLFWAAFLLLATNRSLGSLWALIILTLYYVKTGKFPFLKTTILASFVITSSQYLLGNRNYPLSLTDEFQPPWNFYLEEAIRVFNGSGDWLVSIWGVLSWSELKLPLILVFLNLICSIFLLLRGTRKYTLQRSYLGISVACIYFIPFVLAVTFSKGWPGFWQGRYILPIFIAVILIGLGNSKYLLRTKLLSFSIFIALSSQIYMVLLTYARFNWGLYGTNTPIIANGNSFSTSQNSMFFLFFGLFLLCGLFQLNSLITDSRLYRDEENKERYPGSNKQQDHNIV